MARTYRLFLMELQSELQEAIADAENLEWHHQEHGTAEWRHYVRLATWEKEITERMVRYAATKAANAWKRLQRIDPSSTEARTILGRHEHRRDTDVGRTSGNVLPERGRTSG